MAEILKGAPVAAALTEKLIVRAEALKEKGICPTLAILRIGERPDDLAYESGISKRCEKIGIELRRFVFPEDCGRDAVLEAIQAINNDKTIHGCLMFRPLLDKETERTACLLLDPAKDVDGMTAGSMASLYQGGGTGFPPCTAQACIELLRFYGVQFAGKRVTVIGRSLVIGKPVSLLLQAENATVTMCHSKTVNLPQVCKDAEILIAAAGRAAFVGADCTNPDQILLDVGINTDSSGRLCGDVDFEACEPYVKAITPVPGGVGTVTTTILASHVIGAAENV